MTRTKALGIPAIAALLAQLAAGCGSYDTLDGSGGTNNNCSDETTTQRITESQIEMLEANPESCASLCESFGLYSDTCSWHRDLSCDDTTVGPGDSSGGSAATGDASTDEGTSTGGTTADPSTSGGGNTGDPGTGEAASTGDAGTGGGGSTGDASTGDASTGDPSTSGTSTSGTSTDAASDADTSGAPDGCGGELDCTMFSGCEVGGRGHAALQPAARPRTADALGEWLAVMAHSEAASVVAFQAIADELAAHGAPAELVRRAREAADDEVRHAEVMGALARRRGVEPARPCFEALEIRELEALARENAVEGCVRETWAALEACCQARRAADPELRRAMVGIAADESRHAQLSWDLDAWARTRLSPAAVARVDAARAAAVELLERTVGALRPAPLHERAGIPEPAAARALLRELRQALWS